MGADTSDDEPFWIFDTVGISFWVTKLRQIDLSLAGNIVSTAVLDENWLSTPLEKASFSWKQILKQKYKTTLNVPSGMPETSISTEAKAKTWAVGWIVATNFQTKLPAAKVAIEPTPAVNM